MTQYLKRSPPNAPAPPNPRHPRVRILRIPLPLPHRRWIDAEPNAVSRAHTATRPDRCDSPVSCNTVCGTRYLFHVPQISLWVVGVPQPHPGVWFAGILIPTNAVVGIGSGFGYTQIYLLVSEYSQPFPLGDGDQAWEDIRRGTAPASLLKDGDDLLFPELLEIRFAVFFGIIDCS